MDSPPACTLTGDGKGERLRGGEGEACATTEGEEMVVIISDKEMHDEA